MSLATLSKLTLKQEVNFISNLFSHFFWQDYLFCAFYLVQLMWNKISISIAGLKFWRTIDNSRKYIIKNQLIEKQVNEFTRQLLVPHNSSIPIHIIIWHAVRNLSINIEQLRCNLRVFIFFLYSDLLWKNSIHKSLNKIDYSG